uniref:Retroelement n=1 Tax=Oryza sativa subsp. japonica TaxID=39947 RepID=Q8S5R8_ORYSJ|nr:Putative retroelement [Oryza sativa Japonica Group]
MAEEDMYKTAFRCPGFIGLFQWVVMTFGLKNAGATYQRTMNLIFHDLLGIILEIYVDDIVVKSDGMEGHIADLRLAFERMRRYGLKMNPLKCAFGVSVGKFLGFMVHERGVEIDPKKIEKIRDFKAPTCKKEVQKLLGMYLYTPPVVRAPKAGMPFRLDIASEDKVIGAVLTQEEDGKEYIITYLTRRLLDAETSGRLHSTGILDGSDETNLFETSSTEKNFNSGVGEKSKTEYYPLGTRREGRVWWLGSASKPAGQAWRATAARAVAGDGNRWRGRRRQTAQKAAAAAEDDGARAEDGGAHGREGKRGGGGGSKWEGLEGEGLSTTGGNHGRRRRQWWYSPARGEKRAPTVDLAGRMADATAHGMVNAAASTRRGSDGGHGRERRKEEKGGGECGEALLGLGRDGRGRGAPDFAGDVGGGERVGGDSKFESTPCGLAARAGRRGRRRSDVGAGRGVGAGVAGYAAAWAVVSAAVGAGVGSRRLGKGLIGGPHLSAPEREREAG